MTTITIHLGEAQDGAAGNTGIASGGRNPTPTACLILYPSDSSVKIEQPVKCIYAGSDVKSVKTAETLSKSLNAPIEYKTAALNVWDLGHMKEDTESTLLMRLPPYLDLTPEEKISGGESFNDYKKRSLSEIDSLLKEIESKNETAVVVADPMTCKLATAWIEEEEEKLSSAPLSSAYTIDSDVFLKNGFQNSEVQKIYKEDGIWDVDPLNSTEEEEEEE